VRLSFNQVQRQEQRQVLSQRLIQSMEILQLTLQQLEQRIDEELEQNPVLELESETSAESTDDYSDVNHNVDDEFSPSQEHEPEIKFEESVEHAGETEEFSIAEEFSQNYSDTIDEAPIRSQNWLEEQEMHRADVFANIESPGESLQVYLERQLDWFDISAPLREMVLRIVHNLEPSGYFTYVWEDFLGENHSYEELELAREALTLVQRLDPAGVGGKDLRECLLLQINPDSEYAEVLRMLITTYMEDISANRLPAIAKKIDFPLDTVQGAVAELRHFNPRPGSGFSSNTAAIVMPEIFIEQAESGKYVVRLEYGRTPQLQISKFYKDLMNMPGTDRETKTYIKQKFGSARWLLEAIEQRRDTLLKVSQAIVDHQTAFFEMGQQALKPLKMQQIADIVGMHVTTISRACDEKWVSSPQGVFPLRRLFAGGVATVDGGETVANDAVRSKIREIIDEEDKKNPLSDDAIVKMLENEGIQVARRTIVKYRQLLDIPNSRGRRQWEP